MRRQWAVARNRDLEGSERSQELAVALAMKKDPETIEKIVELFALLDSIGGQAFISSFRSKYQVHVQADPETGATYRVKVPVEPSEPGSYETDGYAIHYDHIATAARDQSREPDAKLPVEPEPEVWHEAELAEPENLRDEIEAEVAAELDAEAEAKIAEAPTAAAAEASEGPEE